MGIMELAVRKFGEFSPSRIRCYDPVVGSTYCPNAKQISKVGSVEGWVVSNSDGLLDQEYPIEKPPGALRVAVMGDSFVSAEAIPQEKNFHSLWEKWLPEKLKKPVEVISFGVMGTGTWQQLHMFHIKAKKYKPDLTVLAFCWCNDVLNNVDQFKSGNPNPLLNEFGSDSLLQRIQVKRKNFNKWLWNHSALYQLSRKRYNHLELTVKNMFRPEHMKPFFQREEYKKKDNKHRVGKHSGREESLIYRKVSWSREKEGVVKKISTQGKPLNFVDTPSMDDDQFFIDSEGWRLTKKLIVKFRDDAKSIGSEFLVIQFVGGFKGRGYYELPDEGLESFLQEQGIRSVNLYGYYRGLSSEEFYPNFIPGDMHFSEQGHENFARMTVDALAAALIGR